MTDTNGSGNVAELKRHNRYQTTSYGEYTRSKFTIVEVKKQLHVPTRVQEIRNALPHPNCRSPTNQLIQQRSNKHETYHLTQLEVWCLKTSKVFTLHTPHFTLHSSHCKLQTSHSTLHTSHFSLLTASFTVQTSYFTLLTSHCFLHTSHCALRTPNLNVTLHTSHFTLHTSHCFLQTSHFTLHSLRPTLPTVLNLRATKKHKCQNGENLLTNLFRSLHAATPRRFTRSSCKRQYYYKCSHGTKQPWRSHYNAICKDWVVKHNRTTRNWVGNCSSKTGSRRQSDKKTILKHFLKGFLKGKLLAPKWKKSADKSLSQPSCSHSNTIYEVQLQKTIVLRMQPWQEATLTQPLQCDLQRLSCQTQ